MADIEKVINGLKHCTTSLGCFECPYSELDERTIECQLQLDRDALELLKAQNGLVKAMEQMTATNEYVNKELERINGLLEERTPVKPKSKSRRGTGGQVYEHRCGKCNSRLFGKQRFCSYCGREVKWK